MYLRGRIPNKPPRPGPGVGRGTAWWAPLPVTALISETGLYVRAFVARCWECKHVGTEVRVQKAAAMGSGWVCDANLLLVRSCLLSMAQKVSSQFWIYKIQTQFHLGGRGSILKASLICPPPLCFINSAKINCLWGAAAQTTSALLQKVLWAGKQLQDVEECLCS